MNDSTLHQLRDQQLPMKRLELLNRAIQDFTNDADVLAVYLSGSMARGDDDLYSDIDLRVVVPTPLFSTFVANKYERAKRWGNVLFYNSGDREAPYVVTHYDCFVKVDTFYYAPEHLSPSLWLKEIKIVYDPHGIVTAIWKESKKLTYQPSMQEIESWRSKFFSYFHEVYRRAMRQEWCYTASLLDKLRWLIAAGWEMSAGRMPNSFGDWSKAEGTRSKLDEEQKALLRSWVCPENLYEIKKILQSIGDVFLDINQAICEKYGFDEDRENGMRIINMVV